MIFKLLIKQPYILLQHVDQAAGQRLVQTTGQMGVPQTEINGQWIVGFDPAGVQNALEN